MPRSLTDVMGDSAVTTWADQIDKDSIARMPFYIHGARRSDYTDQDDREVNLVVLDITLNDPSRKGPRAVITLGLTDERAKLLEVFPNGNDGGDPVGPCITYAVPLKGGQKFWRLESAPDPDDVGEMFETTSKRK